MKTEEEKNDYKKWWNCRETEEPPQDEHFPLRCGHVADTQARGQVVFLLARLLFHKVFQLIRWFIMQAAARGQAFRSRWRGSTSSLCILSRRHRGTFWDSGAWGGNSPLPALCPICVSAGGNGGKLHLCGAESEIKWRGLGMGEAAHCPDMTSLLTPWLQGGIILHTGGPKCQPSAGSYMLQKHNGVFQGNSVGWGVGAWAVAIFPLSIWGATLTAWHCEQSPGLGILLTREKYKTPKILLIELDV